MEFLNELTVWGAMFVVVSLIIADALFGMITAIKHKEFDIRMVPEFVASNVFPFVGGLAVLAAMVQFVGKPYDVLFYTVAVLVAAKYLAELKDKVFDLFEVGE